ncbi:MAG: hypothetical protein KUG75_08970 [Pseudomonadales bacterium]|nr:hypothetical protein [Pseudomonadales bacterium]
MKHQKKNSVNKFWLCFLLQTTMFSIYLTPPLYAEPSDNSEQLFANIPENWNLMHNNQKANIRLVEYAPPDSNETNWTEKLTLESFAQQPLPDPIQLLDSMAEQQLEACDNFVGRITFSGYENGYPASVRLFNCKNDKLTQMQKISLVKAIQGNENFYVISHIMRLGEQQIDISEERLSGVIARWSAHLGAISVCDTQTTEHPCPLPTVQK